MAIETGNSLNYLQIKIFNLMWWKATSEWTKAFWLSKVGAVPTRPQKGRLAVSKYRGMIGLFAASAMMFSSTAVMAAPAPVAQTQASPWAVLSVMSGGAAAVQACGAAAAAAASMAAQPTNGCVLPQVDVPVAAPVAAAPVAVLPAAPVATGLGISPLFLGLAALAAGIGLYFAVRGHHDNGNANSPG